MDRFESFQNEYLYPANESAAAAAIAGIVAVMVPTLIISKIAKRKADQKVATTQNAYFEAHEIPEQNRANYSKQMKEALYNDAVKLLKGITDSSKGKSIRNEITKKVADYIKDYIEDSDRGDTFEPNKLTINFGIYENDADGIDICEPRYSGKGFVPDDNIWEIASYASRPAVIDICNKLKELYAEEIKCGFCSIRVDSEYGTLYIE